MRHLSKLCLVGLCQTIKDQLSFLTTTTVFKEEQVCMLKELVGSIHTELPQSPIIIYTQRLLEESEKMINTWEGIQQFELRKTLFPQSMKDYNTLVLLQVQKLLHEYDYDVILWINLKYHVKNGLKLQYTLEQAMTNSKHLEFYWNGRLVLVMAQRGATKYPMCLNWKQGKMEEYGIEETIIDNNNEGTRMHCNIKLRPDLLCIPNIDINKRILFQQNEGALNNNQIKIAILLPSKNSLSPPSSSREDNNPQKTPFIEHFLPNFLKSITFEESKLFQYMIYVGYDEGDPYWDLRKGSMKKSIKTTCDIFGKMCINLKVLLVKMPPTKTVTFFWNFLFIMAYNDKNDYFYQLNDDVIIESPGWSSAFTNQLKEQSGFGVVGPNDLQWRCSLLTQSMVSRKHYEIFDGKYFPVDIKNWYSDNWITLVYEKERTACFRHFYIKNGVTHTRYSTCKDPPWEKCVQDGKKMIKQYENLEKA